MDISDNTTTTAVASPTDGQRAWYFAGSFIFKIESLLIFVVNTFAFLIIFNSEKCFGKNGFREQLLILCVNDVFSGLTFFSLTFCLERSCPRELLYSFILSFSFCQFTSFGNTLGISLQRFLATKRAGDTKPGWTRKYTAVYFVANIFIMALFLLLYVILNMFLAEELSNIVLVVVFSACVITTDTFCCLTLYYLNKNLKTVSASWASQSRVKPRDRPKESFGSSTNNDIPGPSTSVVTPVRSSSNKNTLSEDADSSRKAETTKSGVSLLFSCRYLFLSVLKPKPYSTNIKHYIIICIVQ